MVEGKMSLVVALMLCCMGVTVCLGSPSSEAGRPSFKAGPPSFKAGPPSSEVKPPSSEVKPPSSEVEPPSSEVEPPSSEVGPPSSEAGRPSFKAGPPSSEAGPLVRLPLGLLRGTYYTTRQGKRISAFMGVPYAEPPVDQNRFKEPLAKQAWQGEWLAQRRPSRCLQYSQFGYSILGSEDCLYVSVYTPKLYQGEESAALLPVIVYIHGGSFMFYTASNYGPEYMIDRDVVLVTVNYRLGPLGFAVSGKRTDPCNLGLKDQREALRWVKANIHYFRGNNNLITIAGGSAGAASVHYQMLSPTSRGLFGKAISMSGNGLNPWALMEDAEEKTRLVAAKLGCPEDPNTSVFDCLRRRPADDIVLASAMFQSWLYYPFSPWAPSVDGGRCANPFIPEEPIAIMKAGKSADVPWLHTFTSLEGLYPVAEFLYDEKLLKELEVGWDKFLPDILDYRRTAEPSTLSTITQQITKEYLQEKTITNPDSEYPFIAMASDRLFTVGVSQAAILQSEVYQSPVYVYGFDYIGSGSLGNIVCGCNKTFVGSSHADDLDYILEFAGNDRQLNEDEMKMKEILIDLWYNFAKNGKAVWGGVEWPSVKEGLPGLTYLHVQGPSRTTLKNDNDLGRSSFWHSLPLKENLASPMETKTITILVNLSLSYFVNKLL